MMIGEQYIYLILMSIFIQYADLAYAPYTCTSHS